jgi:autophagy-related protein 11
LTGEIERLRLEASSVSTSKARIERLEIELDVTRTKHKAEVAARQVVEQRMKDTEASFLTLKQEMSSLNYGAQTNDAANQKTTERLNALESEKSKSALALEQLQARNRRLEEELQLVRRERDNLSLVVRDRDTLFKEQASVAERSLRDHIAETDGDRGELALKQKKEVRADLPGIAVLEQQVAELRQALDSVPQGTPGAKRFQPEMVRLESENTMLRANVDHLNDTLTQLASAARTMYNAHSRTLSTSQNILKASKAIPNGADANVLQSPETPSPPALTSEPLATLPEFDPLKPQTVLDVLSALNLQALDEAVVKIGSNSRKYLKLSKEYR